MEISNSYSRYLERIEIIKLLENFAPEACKGCLVPKIIATKLASFILNNKGQLEFVGRNLHNELLNHCGVLDSSCHCKYIFSLKEEQ